MVKKNIKPKNMIKNQKTFLQRNKDFNKLQNNRSQYLEKKSIEQFKIHKKFVNQQQHSNLILKSDLVDFF